MNSVLVPPIWSFQLKGEPTAVVVQAPLAAPVQTSESPVIAMAILLPLITGVATWRAPRPEMAPATKWLAAPLKASKADQIIGRSGDPRQTERDIERDGAGAIGRQARGGDPRGARGVDAGRAGAAEEQRSDRQDSGAAIAVGDDAAGAIADDD